jgi:protein-disulfide isomerase-like protein with CxxC motif
MPRTAASPRSSVKVNADIAPTLSRRFEVQSIPALLIMRDGQVVGVARSERRRSPAAYLGWSKC